MKFSNNGYPDMGNGLYAKTLSYKEWYEFNLAQRAHYNLVESFPSALGLHFLGGLYFPIPSASLAVLWIVCRHIWSINYKKGGPEARYNGIAAGHALALLGWFGMGVAGGLKLSGLLKW